METDTISARVPRQIIGAWIRYCYRRRMGQAEAIRLAIVRLIEDDPTATRDELTIADAIKNAPYHKPRSY